jgi:hypothetical protein
VTLGYGEQGHCELGLGKVPPQLICAVAD